MPDSAAASPSDPSQKRGRASNTSLSPGTPRGSTSKKLKKTSRACDVCKSKKARCSGTIPCDRCVSRRLKCVYDAQYLRGRPPTPPRHEGDRRVLSTARNSPDLDAAEIEGQYYEPTSALTFLHRAYRRLATQRRSHVDPHALPGDKQPLMSAGDEPLHADNTSSLMNTESLTRLLELPNLRRLVSLYFETCVVTYRMFHQPTVMSWIAHSGDPSSSLTILDPVDASQQFPFARIIGNAKAAAILAIAAITTLKTDKMNSIFDPSWDGSLSLATSDHLFQLASRFTDSEVGPAILESAQARVTQVLYLLQTARINRAWYQLGAAYQIIVGLGLHRKHSNRRREMNNSDQMHPSAVDFVSLQCQRRTFWVAYTIDVYLSVVFGRPRYFHDDDVNQELPLSLNDEDMGPQGPISRPGRFDFASSSAGTREGSASHIPDEFGQSWQHDAESDMDSVIAHTKLARIIGKISRTVYTLEPVSRQQRLAAATRCGHELQAWRTELKPHLVSVNPSNLIPSVRRQAVALKLAYCHALIHAHRPFLLDFRQASGSAGTAAEIGRGTVSDSAAACIAAARAALNTVEAIASDNHVVVALWWMPYVTFCALAVIYVWKIELNARDRTADKFGSGEEPHNDFGSGYSQDIFALAERCHLLLSRDFRPPTDPSTNTPPLASTSDSPSRRYSIILEELRQEARDLPKRSRRCSPSIPAPSLDRDGMPENVVVYAHVAERPAVPGPTQPEQVFNESIGMYEADGAVANTLAHMPPMPSYEWQTTDWLGLDASAFDAFHDLDMTFTGFG